MPKHKTLNLSDAVGRYAMAYVRKVCAQAHVGFSETSPGEDVLAIDGRIEYYTVDVRIQVKGSTKYSTHKTAGLIRVAVKDEWRRKWRKNGQPTYFIFVLMERQVAKWFEYFPGTTMAGAVAYWARIDNLPKSATHIVVDRRHRFTKATVRGWGKDIQQGYGEVV